MNITRHNGHNFADFKANTIWGRRIVGGYLLIIPVELDIFPVTEGPRASLHSLTCHLSIKPKSGPSLIGEMYSLNGPKVYQTNKDPYKPTHEFAIKVTQKELDQIEIERNGGDISFELRLFGHVYEDGNLKEGKLDTNLNIDQSAWLKVLGNTGYSKILTVEISLSGDLSNPGFELAYQKLQEAQLALSRGEWRQAVALCRDCLESPPVMKEKEVSPNKENTKEERYQLIQKMLHLTHLAKHNDNEVAQTTRWDREDAVFMVAATGALISKLAKK